MDFRLIKKEKAFTLIEIVLAIFLLAFALVGIYSAYSIVVVATADNADQLTANYLAQEGIEIVQNIRDQNWLIMDYNAANGTNTATWLDNGLSGCSSGCEAFYGTSVTPSLTGWSGGQYLLANNSTSTAGFYNYTLGSKTKFKRKITITPVQDVDGTPDHIVKVIVQVSWDKKSTILNSGILADPSVCSPANCITVIETLYNWYYPSHQI